MQTETHTQLVPATTAAALMGCSVSTVYRQLPPALVMANGWRLYDPAAAQAWTRRRGLPRKAAAEARQ